MTVLNTRSNIVPTFSRGRVITSTLSHIRFPLSREKLRISSFFVNNFDYRAIQLKGSFNSMYDSLYKVRIQLWPQKTESIRKHLNLIDGVFKFGKIFANLSFCKSTSELIRTFILEPVSFVPKKVRFRKKDIFESVNIFFSFQQKHDFYFFWRVYMHFQMSTRSNKKIAFAAKNVHTLSNSIKFQDLTGLYFLGVGVLNLDSYKLLFEFLHTMGNISDSHPSLSTPKALRSQFTNKLISVGSHFRFS